MGVENISPGSIDGYSDLESLVIERGLRLQQIFDMRVSTGKPLYDEGLEFEVPQLLSYSQSVAATLFLDGLNDPAAATVHRGLYFGATLSEKILEPEDCTFSFETVRELSEDIDMLRTYFTDGTSRYLRLRPKLHDLIGRYMPQLSPEMLYADGAQIAAGLALMHTEEYRLNQFVEKTAAVYSEEVALWDGSLPEDFAS